MCKTSKKNNNEKNNNAKNMKIGIHYLTFSKTICKEILVPDNLTLSLLKTILTRKFNKIFLLKLSYKNSCVKFDAFSKRNG